MFNILHVCLDYLAYCKISHWNSGGPPLSYLPVCGTDHRMAVVGFPPKLGTGTFMTGKPFPLLLQSFDRVIILQCCNVFLENWLIIGNLQSHQTLTLTVHPWSFHLKSAAGKLTSPLPSPSYFIALCQVASTLDSLYRCVPTTKLIKHEKVWHESWIKVTVTINFKRHLLHFVYITTNNWTVHDDWHKIHFSKNQM